MKDLSKLLTLTALVSTLGIVEGASLCLQQPVDIDLHSKRIGIWNLEETINPALPSPTPTSSEIVSINLSGNMIMDGDIQKLLGMLESHGLKSRLSMLDLSDNRLRFEGVKALLPLLDSDNLQWLVLSINNLMVDDFIQLWKEIDMAAYSMAVAEDRESSYESIRDQWAAKVVLLPKGYHLERFPLAKPFVDAHQRYYSSH